MGERINGHAASNWPKMIDACKYSNFCSNSFSKLGIVLVSLFSVAHVLTPPNSKVDFALLSILFRFSKLCRYFYDHEGL